MSLEGQEADWEITEQGFYIATRGFLMRRGYCCANQCRNCPYINWRQEPAWQPVPAEYVKCTVVARKAIIAANALLRIHEEQIDQGVSATQEYHRSMAEHYRFLLERWRR